MKYIITESKVNNLVKLYLDTLELWMWDIGDGEFSVSDGYNGETILSYMYDYNNEGVLHITPKIIEEIRNMFGSIINGNQLMMVICEWFNEKYKTNVVNYEVVMED